MPPSRRKAAGRRKVPALPARATDPIRSADGDQNGREYRYGARVNKVRTVYGECRPPNLRAGEIEKVVVDRLRAVLRHPDVVTKTCRELETGHRGGDVGWRRAGSQPAEAPERVARAVGEADGATTDEVK